MEKPYILHMLTPAKNVSPFDVNMALDAGWTAVVPYTHVELDDIAHAGPGRDFLAGPRVPNAPGSSSAAATCTSPWTCWTAPARR